MQLSKMKKIKVRVKRLNNDAKIPVYKSEEAAGFDVHSVEEKVINPGEVALIGTGIALEIEPGYCWQIWGRSGLGAKGINKFAGLGDSDYRGEFKVVLHNAGKEPFKIEKGDRIAQIVPVPIVQADFEEVEELGETGRGEKGFNSTGMK